MFVATNFNVIIFIFSSIVSQRYTRHGEFVHRHSYIPRKDFG